MRHLILMVLSFSLLATNFLDAQNALTTQLSKNFKAYQLDKVDTENYYQILSSVRKFHDVSLKLGDEVYSLELWDSGIRDANTKVTLASGKKHTRSAPLPMKGYVIGKPDSRVRLTFNDGFLYGFIKVDGKTLNIQPAWYFDKGASRDLILSYYTGDAIESQEKHTCGVHTNTNKLKNHIKSQRLSKSVGDCFEAEISLAADWLMHVEFGDVDAVEDQVTAVLNDVEENYDDEFADAIEYDLNEIWVSDCSTCDPWTDSTDSGDLLNSFRSWAPSNLGSHDVASLWSDRPFDGTTIGLAWVGAVCTGFRYNVLENFSTNADLLRVLQAHELGHNWGAEHASGNNWIMSPSVNTSEQWTTQSEEDILDYIQGINCLETCAGQEPEADFDWEVLEECATGEVEFEDLSFLAAEWLWTFEGGTPNTSTEQNPVVFYAQGGEFDVTLEVFNASGEDIKTERNAIEILPTPFAEFDYDLFGLEVEFTDESGLEGEGDYFWDFGDGEDSTDEEPDHEYELPGTYEVTMEVENDCGFDEITKEIEVFDFPEADFTADMTTGCAGDLILFTDLSYGNIEDWDWRFPGASPDRSFAENPDVNYNAIGTYEVELTVGNIEGEDTETKFGFITILDDPTSSFTHTTNLDTVFFTNTSSQGNSFIWNFGDGNTSTEENPTHIYADSGNYTVQLTVNNVCGSNTISQVVTVSLETTAAFTTVQSPSGCIPYTINFIDNSVGAPTSWNWTFPGGTPSSSTLQNPTVVYSTPGEFSVTLEVNSSFGNDVLTATNYVSISDVPTVSSSFTDSLLTVDFSSTTVYAETILWNFGDGNTSSLEAPEHTYEEEGTYLVTVSVNNSCGMDTDSLMVMVEVFPEAGFSASTNNACVGNAISFIDNSSSNVTSWNWSFPGGTPASSTQQNPSVVYNDAGTFPVSLEVANGTGNDVLTIQDYIVVEAAPSLSSSYQDDLLSVNFSSGAMGAQTVSWDFGDGNSSSESNPMHTYMEEGTYNVTVQATNDCGNIEETLSVTVNLLPSANFSANTQSGCQGLTVNFMDNSSSNATNWVWNFPGGTPETSTMRNPTVTYPDEGSYDVSLTVSNGSGSDTETISSYIEVLGGPNASYDFEISDISATFNNLTNNTTANWTISDGASSTEQSYTHTFESNGTYEVTLAVDNGCGTDLVTFEVTISAYPESNFESDISDGCVPMTVNFIDRSSNAMSYSWAFPGGTPESSSEANPTVVYNNVGTYDVSLIVENQFGNSSSFVGGLIIVNDIPTADFSVSQNTSLATVELMNSSTGATSYEWDFGDGNMSTDENPVHTYSATGTYEITLTAINDCGTVEMTSEVVVEVSNTEELETFGIWNIVPNPSNGQVNLLLDKDFNKNLAYSIIDPSGRKISEGLISSNSLRPQFELEEPGIYFFILRKEDKVSVKRLTIIR